MKSIKFFNNPQSYNPIDSFVVHLSEINNVDELFEQLNKKLLFPYFRQGEPIHFLLSQTYLFLLKGYSVSFDQKA